MTKCPLVVKIAKRGSLQLALECPPIPDPDLAGCKGADLELFFSQSPRQVEKAKNICQNCPVVKDCERWGTRFAAYGVFGGKTPGERQQIDDELPYYEPQVLEEELRNFEQMSLRNLARKHGVSVRTVSRWRQTLFDSLDTASISGNREETR